MTEELRCSECGAKLGNGGTVGAYGIYCDNICQQEAAIVRASHATAAKPSASQRMICLPEVKYNRIMQMIRECVDYDTALRNNYLDLYDEINADESV